VEEHLKEEASQVLEWTQQEAQERQNRVWTWRNGEREKGRGKVGEKRKKGKNRVQDDVKGCQRQARIGSTL
jgi:hypothetical protein